MSLLPRPRFTSVSAPIRVFTNERFIIALGTDYVPKPHEKVLCRCTSARKAPKDGKVLRRVNLIGRFVAHFAQGTFTFWSLYINEPYAVGDVELQFELWIDNIKADQTNVNFYLDGLEKTS